VPEDLWYFPQRVVSEFGPNVEFYYGLQGYLSYLPDFHTHIDCAEISDDWFRTKLMYVQYFVILIHTLLLFDKGLTDVHTLLLQF
jgi:hypothetical protein